MIRDAINRIIELAGPKAINLNGVNYSEETLYRVEEDLRADPIRLSTLTGLVRYIKTQKCDLNKITYFVQIVSPTQVRLVSSLDIDRKREVIVDVNAEIPKFPFERFISNEAMIISMQAMFVDDPETDRALVLQFAGTVTAGSIKEYGDDGVTQKATVKSGIASKMEAIVPSPCTLRPYRTFQAVEQPASRFIFRMREDKENEVTSALFEADGGAWKNEAEANIREYLEDELKETDIAVIG